MNKLDHRNPVIQEASCIAIGEIARNGPLPLCQGGKVSIKTGVKTSSKCTKLDVVLKLNDLLTGVHISHEVRLFGFKSIDTYRDLYIVPLDLFWVGSAAFVDTKLTYQLISSLHQWCQSCSVFVICDNDDDAENLNQYPVQTRKKLS